MATMTSIDPKAICKLLNAKIWHGRNNWTYTHYYPGSKEAFVSLPCNGRYNSTYLLPPEAWGVYEWHKQVNQCN